MKSFMYIATIAVALLAVIANAQESTVEPKNTYFGVDANDEEAVKRRQAELSHEQWEEMFGKDTPPEFVVGPFEPPKEFHEKIAGAFKNLIMQVRERFGKPVSTSPASIE